MRQSHRLIWNSISIWVFDVFRIIAELLLLRFIIDRLGEGPYGLFIIVWSLLPLVNLIQTGLSSAVTRHAAAFNAQGNIEHVNKVLSTTCALSSILGIFFGMALIMFGNWGSGLLQSISPDAIQEIRFAFIGMGVFVLTSFPLMPYAGILHSLQRYDIFAMIKTVAVYIRFLALVIWFHFREPSLEALVVISVVIPLASDIFIASISYRLFPGLRKAFHLIDWGTAKVIFGFSTVILLTSLSLTLGNTGSRWIMGYLASASFVAKMTVMMVPSKLISEAIQAMTLSIMPAASKYSARSDTRMQRELLIRGTRYVCIALICLLMGVSITAEPFLTLWMGRAYGYLYPYVIVLCIGAAVWMSTSVAFHIMRGTGFERRSLEAEAAGNTVRLAALVFICLVFSSPFWAVAIAVSAGYTVTAVIRLVYCVRSMNLSPVVLIYRAYAQPLVIGLPIGILMIMITEIFNLDTLLCVLFVSAISIVLYLFMVFLLLFTEDEKRLATSVISTIRTYTKKTSYTDPRSK